MTAKTLRSIAPLALALLAACAAPRRVSVAGSGRLLHTVAFFFERGTPVVEVEALAELYRTDVPAVPGVLDVFVGRPAGTKRDVVDNSYTLLASTLFTDRAAARGWQTHAIHAALKKRFNPRLVRVVVFDTIE